MAASKPVNYTPEQTAAIIESYKNGTDVAMIAEAFGKTTRSIVAKLSREGVYQKKETEAKTGEGSMKKAELAAAIGAVLNLNKAATDSLTKATVEALTAIFKALANSKPF